MDTVESALKMRGIIPSPVSCLLFLFLFSCVSNLLALPPKWYLEPREGDCADAATETGLLTDEFLDFTSSKGNNLRAAGLTAGCKWCLCASRWKEAMEAAKGPDDPVVPKYVPPRTLPILRAFFSSCSPYLSWCSC